MIDWDKMQTADDKSASAHTQLCECERVWRNEELTRADRELLKVQDGMGSGSVSAWREYRCALRDWPAHPEFPQLAHRPIAPDAK